jgi:hypothetical protein
MKHDGLAMLDSLARRASHSRCKTGAKNQSPFYTILDSDVDALESTARFLAL